MTAKRAQAKATAHEHGTRNVYADLGVADPAGSLVKAQLVTKTAEMIAERGYTQTPARRILILRGQRVLPGSDLATLYETTTKALNQAVRGVGFFKVTTCGLRNRPWPAPQVQALAFTEHGAIMAAAVLNSPHSRESRRT